MQYSGQTCTQLHTYAHKIKKQFTFPFKEQNVTVDAELEKQNKGKNKITKVQRGSI